MTKKQSLITKNAIIVVILAALFILIYIGVVLYTYARVENMAQDTLLQSTVSSTTSFHKVVENDMAQIQYAANTFALEYPSITDDNISEFLNTFILAQQDTAHCSSLIFVGTDRSYAYSNGERGYLPDNINTKEAFAITKPTLANIGVLSEGDLTQSYIYCPVVVDDKKVGILVGTYDYDTVLTETYPSEYYTDECINLIVNPKGEVILNATSTEINFGYDMKFFDFLEDYKDSDTDIALTKNISAKVVDVVVGPEKYTVAYATPHEGCQICVVRIVPTNVLFAQTGNILVFLTVASLLFFFGLMIVAYKFYKTLSASTEKIRNIAYVDPLTGFNNFAKFKEDALELLENNRDDKNPELYYLCCIDMIGFRYINDAFGYDVGDQILIEITESIDELLFEDELFARISGDKFIVLTKRNFTEEPNNLFLQKLTGRISNIQPLAKSHIRLEAQMGIYEIHADDINTISINAMYDRCLVALYSIEHDDTGSAIYDSSIHEEQIEKKVIESKMHDALANGEFCVYIQPKYRTNNAKLASGEALIRWIDPEKGLVPPIKFIPIFEQNRFVHDIDLYVMEVVSRFMRLRLNEGLPVVPISLNISPVEMSMPNFKESYIAIKDKYNIPDGLIELEFTEGIFFENEEYFRQIICEFQSHGFRCSIDDFGSGYSSLNILKSLPVNTLKLDRLFFKESDDMSRDRSIVRSVVAMARSLNIMTVAEGVETTEVVDFLKLIGCTFIQGYVFARPMPLTEFEEKLDSEDIDISTDIDFDKFEAVPLDMPLTNSIDSSLRKTYAAICEINTGGNLYHIYFPGEKGNLFNEMPERGFYTNFISNSLPKFIHEKDLGHIEQLINPINLNNHFKTEKELDFEYKHMRADGAYSWMKVHIIKAGGNTNDSQIYFAYFNVIDNYKVAEEKLETVQTRFESAYQNFNGMVIECDIMTGQVEILESHPNMLNALSDVKDYDQFRTFILNNLLHPDEKEKLTNSMSLERLRDYFNEIGKKIYVVDLLAKPSRKVDYYNCYRTTYKLQSRKNKILLTIEDITEQRLAEAITEIQYKAMNIAFANSYHSYIHVNLTHDTFELISYANQYDSTPKTIEGKYSLYLDSTIKQNVKESDRETFEQIFSPKGLKSIYDEGSSRPFKITYQRRENENSEYKWFEAILFSMPLNFGTDENMYIFRREIEDNRTMEQNLNEYAHRLSYSLAMFDYVYSVDIRDEKVELIGGLCFDTDLLNTSELSYSELTMQIKNSQIHEDDRPAFRRFTYLDSLVEYFSSNSASITKYFAAENDKDQVVEVSVIYGSRESKLTYFVRKINKVNILSTGVVMGSLATAQTPVTPTSLNNSDTSSEK